MVVIFIVYIKYKLVFYSFTKGTFYNFFVNFFVEIFFKALFWFSFQETFIIFFLNPVSIEIFFNVFLNNRTEAQCNSYKI